MHRSLFLAALIVSYGDGYLSAAPRDIAELFPANTLVYAEVSQSESTLNQLAQFLKGTPLEHPLPVIDKIRNKQQPNTGIDLSRLGELSCLLGPEARQDLGRIDSAAIGIMPTRALDGWCGALVVLPGKAILPGIAMRMFLCSDPSLRKLTSCEGVDLYQRNTSVWQAPMPGAEDGTPKTQLDPFGPVYALQPGFILVASDKDTATAVVKRFKASEQMTALANAEPFRRAALSRGAPGVFIYADGAALQTRFLNTPKDESPIDSQVRTVLRKLLPPGSLQSISARLQLDEHGIDLSGSFGLDPKLSPPLVALLRGPALGVGRVVERSNGAWANFTMNLPDKPQRVERLTAVLDPLIVSSGCLGPTASELIRELDEKKIVSAALWAEFNSVSLIAPAVPTGAKTEKQSSFLPVLVLHADAEAPAGTLHDALPGIMGLLTGQQAGMVTETVAGLKLRTFEPRGTPLNVPVYSTQSKRNVALGLNRAALIGSLEGAPSQSRASDIPSDFGRFQAVASFQWDAFAAASSGKIITTRIAPPPIVGIDVPPGQQAPPPFPLSALMRGLPPLLAGIGVENNEVRFTIRQRDTGRVRSGPIESLFEWLTLSWDGPGGVGYMSGDLDSGRFMVPAFPLMAPAFPPNFPPPGP